MWFIDFKWTDELACKMEKVWCSTLLVLFKPSKQLVKTAVFKLRRKENYISQHSLGNISTVYLCSISGLLWQNYDGHLKLSLNQSKAMCLGEICMLMAIKGHRVLHRWSTIRLKCIICACTSHQTLKALRNVLSFTPKIMLCFKKLRIEQVQGCIFGIWYFCLNFKGDSSSSDK